MQFLSDKPPKTNPFNRRLIEPKTAVNNTLNNCKLIINILTRCMLVSLVITLSLLRYKAVKKLYETHIFTVIR